MPAHPGPGSVKGLTSAQLEALDCHVILGNTYHLENRPGSELVAACGGLHGFINWPRWVWVKVAWVSGWCTAGEACGGVRGAAKHHQPAAMHVGKGWRGWKDTQAAVVTMG